MDSGEVLNVRFHFGGEFLRIGPDLKYIGGDEAMSSIERDKVSFPELKGHLRDHCNVKDAMKYYFLIPGKDLGDGLLFLYDDNGCLKMSEHISEGGVAEVYVECIEELDGNGSQDSGSDFEAELGSDAEEIDSSDDEENANAEMGLATSENVLVTDRSGAVKEILRSPSKTNWRNLTGSSQVIDLESESGCSQVVNAASQVGTMELMNAASQSGRSQAIQRAENRQKNLAVSVTTEVAINEYGDSNSSDDDSDYVPLTDDSGVSDDEAVELKQHAKQFKKKLKDSQKWVDVDGSGAVPIDLVSNIEEVLELDFDSEDEDYSYDEASDEEGRIVRRNIRYVRYDSSSPIPHFSLGMVFRSKHQMRKALVKYGLVTFRSIMFLKSEDDRVRAKCGWPGCPWLIYGAQRSRCSRFQVITYEPEHHCAPNRDNHLVSAKVIAKRYEHFIMANPTWKIDSIKSTVLKDFFADVSTSKCKAAKKLVLDKILVGMKGEYTKVFDYQLELLRSNPGSTIAVALDPSITDKHVFQRFYVCFNALKEGFKAGCRRVIGLDGCFFKGAYQGELLAAIGRDANNQMYPVAWAVVEQETTENWLWFLGHLIKDLDINDNGDGWVFISDQQKGLLNSMKAYLPRAEHRMCARHIYANWRKKHRDHDLQKKFWAIAKASNREDFMYYKAKLALETPEGAKDIMNTHPSHWARAFFKVGSMCESVDNNMCESFNHAIIDARFYPIISMLEKIRCKMMVRIQENRTKCLKWHGTICPNIFKKLKSSIKRTQFCDVLWNGKEGFEVKHVSGRGRSYTVNLEKKTCSCGYFQLAGLPCCHAISAIYKCGRVVDDFIDKCYSTEQFMKTYDHCLQPVEGEAKWPVSQNPRPEAPGYVRMPGRPRKNNRKREEGEAPKGKKLTKQGIQMKCSLCAQNGHNKTTCKKNKERGKTRNAFLVKAGRKMKATQQANTQSSSQQVQRKGKEKVDLAGTSSAAGLKRKASEKKSSQNKTKQSKK